MSFLFSSAPKTQASTVTAAVGLRVQTSVAGLTVPLVYGQTKIQGNLIWYGDFKAIPHTSSSGGGGKGGGGGGGGSTTYTYTTSVMIGLCAGAVGAVGRVWSGKDLKTLADLGMVVGLGTVPQAPWPYLVTYHTENSVGYPGIAYVAAANLDLGDSDSLPNFNFEMTGRLGGAVPGKADADPAAVMQDLLLDAANGLGFPTTRLGDLSEYSTYCKATGLLISPAWTNQTAASDLLSTLAELTNTGPVWSEGMLRMVPYGDTAITGNGVTYTPPSAPLFDLTDDDFLYEDGEDPVKLQRKRAADSWNVIKVEFYDRNSAYDPEIAEAKDNAAIERYGVLFDSTKEAHIFADADAAGMSAQLMLQRQSVLNGYTFRLPVQWSILDPMDIVTITDAALGLSKQWVRVTQIEEDEDGNLSFTVEEYLQGTGAAPSYSRQGSSGYVQDYNAPPGDAAAPVIFEPPLALTGGGYELWAASYGQTGVWGSANVWASTTGDSYKKIGAIATPARMGTVLADSLTSMDVDIKASGGQLISGTAADAANLLTLCYVGGEYIAYTDAALIGEGRYRLSGLVRGAYGTSQTPHASGEPFVRIDAAIFKYGIISEYVGKPFYVKLQSVNLWGSGVQELADLTPAVYYPNGKPILDPPPDVESLAVQQNGAQATFQWPQVISDYLDGYSIRYAPKGQFVWENANGVTSVTRGTLITNSALPPGDWTVGIKAVDVRKNHSVNAATADISMVNANDLVVAAAQAPVWPGTITNMVRHHTGVLIPLSKKTAQELGNRVFTEFVPEPVESCSYEAPEIDLGFDEDAARVWAEMLAALGSGAVGSAEPKLEIDYRQAAGGYSGFRPWTVGAVQAQFVKARVVIAPPTGVAYLSDFKPVVDVPQRSESGAATVEAGGTMIPFAKQFHNVPVPSATAVGGSALVATIVSRTQTGFTVKVFNNSGTDIGGAITWTAQGA